MGCEHKTHQWCTDCLGNGPPWVMVMQLHNSSAAPPRAVVVGGTENDILLNLYDDYKKQHHPLSGTPPAQAVANFLSWLAQHNIRATRLS